MCLNKSSMFRSLAADLVDMAIDHIKISLDKSSRAWHMRPHAYIPGYPTGPRSGCENTSYPHYGIAWLCKCSLPQQDSFHSNLYHAHKNIHTHAQYCKIRCTFLTSSLSAERITSTKKPRKTNMKDRRKSERNWGWSRTEPFQDWLSHADYRDFLNCI